MSLARVVTFEGVTRDRIEKLKQEMENGEPPADIPATELLMLYDAEAERSLVVLFFANEDDYRLGDATLNAMPRDDTPGGRTSVTRYEVALHVTR